MHASYLSMYLCLSITTLLVGYNHLLFSIKRRNESILVHGAISILIVGILLLSSRMQLVIMILGLAFFIASRLARRIGMVRALLMGFAMILLLLCVALLFPVNRERFKQAINFRNEYSINSKWGEMQMRPLIWICAGEIIRDNPIVGVGIGDSNEALVACYQKNKFGSLTYFPNVQFNAHNQLLETTIQPGIVGMLLLILSVAYPLWRAIRERNLFYVVFIAIFALSCIPESMLEAKWHNFLCII